MNKFVDKAHVRADMGGVNGGTIVIYQESRFWTTCFAVFTIISHLRLCLTYIKIKHACLLHRTCSREGVLRLGSTSFPACRRPAVALGMRPPVGEAQRWRLTALSPIHYNSDGGQRMDAWTPHVSPDKSHGQRPTLVRWLAGRSPFALQRPHLARKARSLYVPRSVVEHTFRHCCRNIDNFEEDFLHTRHTRDTRAPARFIENHDDQASRRTQDVPKHYHNLQPIEKHSR
jgi:hypothetical protein